MIGDELDTHLDLLEETDHLVDRTENRLGMAAKRLAKVAKGTKGCGKLPTFLALSDWYPFANGIPFLRRLVDVLTHCLFVSCFVCTRHDYPK